MKRNEFLSSKPRYEILDGLRGVAALMIIVFHIFETYIPQFGTQIINHGYLAVDFFFILSGYVVGYAYDDRWDRMTIGGFFKRRLVRLHPMVIAGTIIGASLFLFGDGGEYALVTQSSGWKIALCFVMGILMIPCPVSLDIRGWQEFNSFNGPNWSLTFEYIANILYALVFRYLPKTVLAVLTVCCAFLTLDLTLGWNVFGILKEQSFSVMGGWSMTPDQIYIGFCRLLFPFLCGLLLSRSGRKIDIRGGFLWCSVLLIVIFSIPQIEGKACLGDGIYQAIAILTVFPVILLVGAGSHVEGKCSGVVCKFLGDISYPVYMTHFPLIYMQKSWVWRHTDALLWQHIVLNAGVFVMSVILAWTVYKAYDLPVRDWLTEHWLKSKSSADR